MSFFDGLCVYGCRNNGKLVAELIEARPLERTRPRKIKACGDM